MMGPIAQMTQGGPPDLFNALGIGSIVAGAITAFRPYVADYFADRRHRREMEALDMANDLARSNERLRELEKHLALLTEENVLLKQEVAHNRDTIEAMRANWNAPAPPPPLPRSSDSIPVLPLSPPPPPEPRS